MGAVTRAGCLVRGFGMVGGPVGREAETIEERLDEIEGGIEARAVYRREDFGIAGDARKRILVFSMAGGTGRSYHADLSCANTERRIHYLLEPGWRADQAIQGLGRTHRTHQAASSMFWWMTLKASRRSRSLMAPN